MNRSLSISSLIVAAIVLLMLSIVPHHHHKGMACLLQDTREHNIPKTGNNKDICYNNDSDTKAPNKSDSSDHDKKCPGEAQFVAPGIDSGTKYKYLNADGHDLFSPLYYILVDSQIGKPTNAVPNSKYEDLIVGLRELDYSSLNGLRAPPCHANNIA